ncbi:hypothetical protein ARAM_007674 [Aspergillus rambellii]|uniref:Uncharacterized protein n=1 Tax=Aspergillus rambellii TaxID=308745 RepID=A0A0F8UR16_9EURO|nr:hypothetical protein ARAM_007674 [Aspergillus rambellii]
MEEILLQQNLL